MLLLGFDLGSSSVKAALVDAATGQALGVSQYPPLEMPIAAPHADWAEQDPADWWTAACAATRKLLNDTGADPRQIAAIGIGYQMHGLVCLSAAGEVLRPAIIWCDSRAVEIGERAFEKLGNEYCLRHLLNSPGNFTASKLNWVRVHEPALFDQIDKIMLPGDYLAYRMTGEIRTTVSGLSEGMLWDFLTQSPALALLEHYDIPQSMLPELTPTVGEQGRLNAAAAAELGLPAGIPVGYRAGDQPNNAMALNVLRPGEVAATGGTSGVVYVVTEQPLFDPKTRVNSFAHVNYTLEQPRTGVLLCINGAGSAYRWMRQLAGQSNLPYDAIETMAASVPVGSNGLVAMPFGNGAERMLSNRNPGAAFHGIQFNQHETRHFYRAVLESIAYSFVYGMEMFQELKVPVRQMRVGHDNLFQSEIFSKTLATLMQIDIEMLATTGAAGAAKAAGVAVGAFPSLEAAMQGETIVRKITPEKDPTEYLTAFQRWKTFL